MRLGIMQPYFFPYAQQLRHIRQCDLWITFDTAKFSRKSWMMRNRIINKDTEWSYVSVPTVKGASKAAIQNAEISDRPWQDEMLNALQVYKNKAPFFEDTMSFIKTCINTKHQTVGELNLNILKSLTHHLKIDTEIKALSNLAPNLPDNAAPGEWALHITKAIGASIYSNAPGGKELFDKSLYSKNGIHLEFYEPISLDYDTPGFDFVPGLSILDTLMWMGAEDLSHWCHKQ